MLASSFWGRRSNSGNDSYKPLVRPGQDSNHESHSGADAERVRRWLLECSEGAAEEVLCAVARVRPALVTAAGLVARAAEREAYDKQHGAAEGLEARVAISNTSLVLDPSQPVPSILQFSCAKYFCLEEEPSIVIEVLRLRGERLRAEVHYTTKDQTARAGKNYEATSGVLVFEPGEVEKTIEVKLIDDSSWGGILEFHVVLQEEGLVNAVLDNYLGVARVQRIDDDVFPTNTFRKQILGRKVHEINQAALLFEYFKLNLADPVLRAGTVKLIALGQLRNLFFLVTLFANVYLVNLIVTPVSQRRRGIVEPHVAVMLLVLSNVLPMGVLNFLDIHKYSWRLSGTARMGLASGLGNAFLNYNEASRRDVNAGALVQAMTQDTETLIKAGYTSFLEVFQLLGQILCCIAFQLVAPLAFGSPSVLLTLAQMALFPVSIAIILALRSRSTGQVLQARLMALEALVSHVNDMVANFRLIADFNRRYAALDKHEENVRNFSALDNRISVVLESNIYMMKWLTLMNVTLYTLIGASDVLDGKVPPGVFLTCLRVFITVGGMWDTIYRTCLQAFNSIPALERIVEYTNLPGDTRDRMVWSRRQREATHSQRMQQTSSTGEEGHRSSMDLIPIRIRNLTLNLRANAAECEDGSYRHTQMLFDSLDVEQGKLVSLVGKRGEGKSTLLKILGGALLPHVKDAVEGSLFFVPSHLRVLHVPLETMFIRGSLYANLTFGCVPGHPDARVDRVKAICRRLDISPKIVESIDPSDTTHLAWAESLSSSEKHLVVIARALVANPEMLCIHKPMLNVNASTAQLILELLREFVDKRGIAMDDAEWHIRRPRTCILTSTRATSLTVSDEVLRVDSVSLSDSAGIHRVEQKEGVIASEVQIDDLC